jgi:hypothetical protein
VGIAFGRLDRSTIPETPSIRYRVAHLQAVTGETMNILAATMTGHRSSPISRASRRRARGVRAALAWDTKASWVREAVELDSSTSQQEVFATQQLNRDSRNNVPVHHTQSPLPFGEVGIQDRDGRTGQWCRALLAPLAGARKVSSGAAQLLQTRDLQAGEFG